MRDLLIVLTGRVVQVLTSILMLRLLTWRLDQVQMGRLTLLVTVFTFFALVLVNPVGSYINRQLHSWDEQGTGARFLGYGLLYLLGVCSLASIILWLFGGRLAVLIDIPINSLILIVALYLFANTLNQTIIPSLNLLGKRLQWMMLTLISLWVGLAASVYISGFNPSAEFWMYGQIIGFSVGALLAVSTLLQSFKPRHSKTAELSELRWSRISPILFFALPLSLTVMLNWFQFQSFRFFFGELESLARLGLFAAGYAVSAGILGAFETTAIQYFQPGFYRNLKGSDRQGQISAWSNYAALIIPMTLLFVAFISTMTEPLLRLLVDEKYWGASQFVVLAALLEASRVIGNTYVMAAHALKETRSLLIPQAAGAICVLVLVPVLLSWLGETGFLAALLIASAIYLLAMRQVVNKLTGVRLQFNVTGEVLGGICILLLIWVGSRVIVLTYLYSILLICAGLLVCAAVLWIARDRIIDQDFPNPPD